MFGWLKLAPLVPVIAWTLSVATAAERVHVVIPAGPGGGLDGTAREAGRVLVELGLVERMSFENVSGGGGGRAMAYFLENAARFDAPLLVNSTPLLVRSLQGVFPYGLRLGGSVPDGSGRGWGFDDAKGRPRTSPSRRP